MFNIYIQKSRKHLAEKSMLRIFLLIYFPNI